MPKCFSKGYLIKDGTIIKPEEEIILTKQQMIYLGDKVEKIEADVNNLENLTVDELKEIAENQGIEGFNKLKKDELIEAIETTE